MWRDDDEGSVSGPPVVAVAGEAFSSLGKATVAVACLAWFVGACFLVAYARNRGVDLLSKPGPGGGSGGHGQPVPVMPVQNWPGGGWR